VFGLDEQLAQLGGGSVVLAMAAAVLLGVRHATDPDHLTAVAALIAGDDARGSRRARRLGLAWGLGHGATLFACGLPLVVAGNALPERVRQAAEATIGALIALLALRLLLRWRAGAFHSHPHRHGGRQHAHPHVHVSCSAHEHEREHGGAAHDHRHEEHLGRTPRAAFAIGLVHGVGGSAGAGILLIGVAADGAPALAALVLFAAATACSMAFVSAAFGSALASGALARRLEGLIPAMGVASLVFGVWYAAGALHAAPYPL
jgi:ABC-type nickel/cobalt efflux system permease component RcnA